MEGRYPRRIFADDLGVVGVGIARWRATHFHVRARPYGPARAAVAAFLVAHHRAPFFAVHETMPVGEWLGGVVERAVVAGTDKVPDLVGERIHGGGALVVDGGERVRRFRRNA